jgi:TonB-dependent starch-binding outer membrane protein SusC
MKKYYKCAGSYLNKLCSWKIFKFMRNTLLLIFITVLQAYANDSYSQNTKLTLNLNNVTVANVLEEIQSNSEFYFLFNAKLIDVEREVSVSMENKTISEILNYLFSETGVNYLVYDRQIILTPGDVKPLASANQQQKITGTVTDKNGTPLPGVNIVVTGTTQGTMSDNVGKYSIEIPQGAKSLTFSFVGMEPQEIIIGTSTQLNITMAESAIGLGEIVVIGYGTQRKVSLTGSVTKVTNKELKFSPTLSVSNSLAGLLPGVITTNSSGEPGNIASVLIRGLNTTGNNSPLVVVDGIQGVSGWERISSSDIESISVLKDASATIYGARAANGVIIITTKRGSLSKPIISYTVNQAVSTPTRLPKMANSAQYADWCNYYLTSSGQPPMYTEDEIKKFADGSDPVNYPNTDWYSLMKEYSLQSQHNLSVRGGSEKVKYFVSGSFSNEDGNLKNSNLNFKTYSIRSNIDAQISKSIKLGFDLNGSLTNSNTPNTGWANWNPPTLLIYWTNGLPTPGVSNNNQAVSNTTAAGNNNSKTRQFLTKIYLEILVPWIQGLSVDGYFAYTDDAVVKKNWIKPYTLYNYDKATDTYTPTLGGGILLPQMTQSLDSYWSTLLNLRIKYEKHFNGHTVSTFIATEQAENFSNIFSAYRTNFPSPALDELFAGSLINQQATGTSTEVGRLNYFGRVNYGFKDKYLLDFNFRYDGSCNFPEGKRFGFFPGISAGWRVSQENFVKNNFGFMDELKLRASIGKIGNDAVPAFQYLQTYTYVSGSFFGQSLSQQLGLVGGVSPNPNITWEVANIANIGLDGSLWEGLLGFSVDLFKQKRSNILATRNLSVPYYTGLILPQENIGVAENKGIELELTHSKVIREFSYRIAGNVAYSKNKIIDIDEASNIPEWQKAEGHAIGATTYYQALGIFYTQDAINSSPIYPGTKLGDLQYADQNGDKVINSADMITMDKTNIPRITGGLNLSMTYKSFSLFANFIGQAKVWQYFIKTARFGQNSLEDIIVNLYRTGSMNSKYPNIPTMDTQTEPSGLRSSFWLMDASFVRLKTLELSYALPQNLLTKFKIAAMRVYLNGNNLFTLDKLKWSDPEGRTTYGEFYPQNKIYNLGLNISF